MKNRAIILVVIIFAAFSLAACIPQSRQKQQPTPTPVVLSVDEVKNLMAEGAQAREAGDYQTGEDKLSTAFAATLNASDSALAIEAGNNLSIQYRLSAGRANRTDQNTAAQQYSQKSLDVYDQLRAKNWFNENDPGLARNWAHALLYAGRIDQAIPALEKSISVQTNPAAEGDELNHLAAAYFSQGKFSDAKPLLTKGISLVEKNNGSKIWLTFGLMTQASTLSKLGQTQMAETALNKAATIATENKLFVRQEEITFMLQQPLDQIDVLEAVGTPADK